MKKAKRTKIRLSSWYWGNYVWSDSYLAKKNGWRIGSTAHGHIFEEYEESKHGWHHSEEYAKGQLTPYSKEN
jgi:hypothetical protein